MYIPKSYKIIFIRNKNTHLNAVLVHLPNNTAGVTLVNIVGKLNEGNGEGTFSKSMMNLEWLKASS